MESIRSVLRVHVVLSFHTDIPLLQSNAVTLGNRERTSPTISASRPFYGIHFIPRSRWFGVCSASQRQMCNLLMRVCLLSEVIHFLDMGCICSKSSYENISKSKSKKKAKDKPADVDRTMCDGVTLVAF